MIRLFSINLTILTCLVFVWANETLAQNVTVELSEDGTLTIVEEFSGGNNSPFTTIFIEPYIDRVYVSGIGTSVNGQVSLDFGADDVKSIEVTNVDWLVVTLVPYSLYADLTVQGADVVAIEGIGGFTGIFGNTTICNGLGSGVVSISDIQLFGNLSISTGHAFDSIQFGRPYGLTNRWGPVAIHGNMSINTGQQQDELWISNDLYVGGDVEIQLGQGRDLLLGEERLTTAPESNVSISLGQQ